MIATQLVRKLVLGLAVLGSLAAPQIASAANIEFDVVVNGYGWVIVKPGSNTGGAIRWDGSNYYTDRVNRGERIYIFATPSARESIAGKYDVRCASLNTYLVNPVTASWYGWCWYQEYVVSTNPNADNIFVEFKTNLGNFPKRIPIGLRKP
jgi:hypothetical protein